MVIWGRSKTGYSHRLRLREQYGRVLQRTYPGSTYVASLLVELKHFPLEGVEFNELYKELRFVVKGFKVARLQLSDLKIRGPHHGREAQGRRVHLIRSLAMRSETEITKLLVELNELTKKYQATRRSTPGRFTVA